MNLNIKHKLFHKHVSHSYIVRRHHIIIVKLYVLIITTYPENNCQIYNGEKKPSQKIN